ncbi:MAG: Rieske 2Fe-2S domain-containing protein [Rhizobiales bacterium]|nr:Rieske 2Fe-2S domain-containing protein [Hyphomicrobiales bacterium]NRB13350.1 Rieske 2Fe-2S domain-containing protein [Hyphomicrobiales bacterium]
MTDDWKNHANAPKVGQFICHSNDIENNGYKSLLLNEYPIIVTKTGNGINAFVNMCPHQYLPFDYLGTGIISQDGSAIMCSSHAAKFCIKTAKGTDGFGLGHALERIPLSIDEGGRVCVADI